MACVLEKPLHDTGSVVTIGDVVAKGRKAVWLTALFHFGELLEIELLVFDRAPVIGRVIHGEARGQGSVGADDEPVLTCPAAPMLSHAAHETFHVLQPRN